MRYIPLLLISLSFSVAADVELQENTRKYPVVTDSIADLHSVIDEATPIQRGERIFHALTTYEIDWQLRFDTSSRVCEVEKVTTTLDLQYTLPKLDSQNDEVKQVWSQWFPRLAQYQHQKGELAVVAAESLDKQLKRLPKAGKCNALKKQAEGLATKANNELAAQIKLLDEKTQFGRTELAWLADHLK